MGGEAVANGEDISDREGAKRLVDTAIDTFGGLDVLVNNAGILRDRMLVNMTVERVGCGHPGPPAGHLRPDALGRRPTGGTGPRRARPTTPASSTPPRRRASTATSGQTNYGAAKAGIASLTVIAAMELGRYGVTVNAIAPAALTRMTENLSLGMTPERKPDEFEPNDPDNIAPLVVWLGSPESKDITGRVFNVFGGHIRVAEGWVAGPAADKGDRWETAELGGVIPDLVAKAAPNADMFGRRG